MEYQRFVLRIEPPDDDGYIVKISSEVGESESRLVLPFNLDSFAGVAAQLSASIRGTREARVVQPELPSAPEVGAQLYTALFSGAANNLYQQSRGKMLGDDKAGLRITLQFDVDHPEVQKLATLPWEYMYDPTLGQYIGNDVQTTIARYVEVPRPNVVHPIDGRLRILVVMANPNGTHPLKLAKEKELIEASWAQNEQIEVEFLERASRTSLSDTLADNRFHVLHFMGHGAFDKSSGAGVLLLEDENGDPEPLTAEALRTFLSSATNIRLALLNACETAKATSDYEQDPFAGVANALLMGGLPAVIAMQFPISDEAALAFSETFYRRLIRGYPVDQAVAQARRKVYAKTNSLEWGTPVLLMRTADGRLFDLDAPHTDDETGEVETLRDNRRATPATSNSKPAALAGAGALAVLAAAGVGAYLFGVFDSTGFDWNKPPALYVGYPATFQVEKKAGDKKVALDPDTRIELDANSVAGYSVRPDRLGAWIVTPTGERKTITLKAEITEPGERNAITVVDSMAVTMEAKYQSAYDAIETELKDPSRTTAELLAAIDALATDNLFSAERDQIATWRAQLAQVARLREEAATLAPDRDQPIPDRITALEQWADEFVKLRGAAPASGDGLSSQLTALKATWEQFSIDRLSVCPCGSPNCSSSLTAIGKYNDRTAASRSATSVCVTTQPAYAPGSFQCRLVGPGEKSCDPRPGENTPFRARGLNVAGPYALELRTATGDLVARHEFTVN